MTSQQPAPASAIPLARIVERVGRLVRDRGDVELVVALDRLVEIEDEGERNAALATIVQTVSAQSRPDAPERA